MRERQMGLLVQSWRALLDAGPVAGLGDGSLLERFADRDRDTAEAAFAALVARHGPMVRRVCRGVLADPHDADDAFQATFLVLARKAQSLRQPDRLANWLYGTAHRASKRLRAEAARRRKHETARATLVVANVPAQVEAAEAVLEEVTKLPQPCRVAVVLCDLEGLTQDEAARHLGCSDRTLRRRLTQAHDLLRNRLSRRGFAPSLAILARTMGPVPESLIESTARAAGPFAAGKATAGVVPASALILAEGVIKTMTWTKLKAIAVAMGCLLAFGGGIGAAKGFMPRPQDSPARPKPGPKAEVQAVAANSSPADQYKALVKRWDDAIKVYQEAMLKTKTDEERKEIYLRIGPFPKDHLPAFVALAEKYPGDPAAGDALFWVLERSLSGVGPSNEPGGRAVARTLDILARDHADDPRLGPLCPTLTWFQDGTKVNFFRAIAGRSKDRTVKGRATLALAESLRMEAAFAEMFQHPDAPLRSDDLLPVDFPEEGRKQFMIDPATIRRNCEEMYSKNVPDFYQVLKKADPAALKRESDQAYDRVVADFGDVPAVPFDGPTTRETLADVVRRRRSPAVRAIPLASRYKPLAEAFQAALKKANDAEAAAGQGEPGVKAYIAAAPKWADFGPKMWAIAEAAPRSPDGFDALLWLIRPLPFFDSQEERSATLGKAVDALIADHLDFIGDHLSDRKVIEAFNSWYPMPGSQAERIARALFERGKTREIRGRMGLMLARFRKAEADLIGSLEVRGADPAQRPEIALFAPAYLDRLRRTGHRQLAEEAATLFEKVKADYGDVPDINGVGPTGETLAIVADREVAEIRTLAPGQAAPEIVGKDVQGKPLALSEFRGKVVLLDFGSHEHCGGCKLVYPKQRELVEKYKARPFAVLGINSGDKLETLKDLLAKKEVTWPCWFDGDDILHPGPITARWNIKGLPTFLILDHKGVIRFKDLHPFDPTFESTIESLIKEAEANKP